MNALAEVLPLEPVYDQARENLEHIVGYLDSEDEISRVTFRIKGICLEEKTVIEQA